LTEENSFTPDGPKPIIFTEHTEIRMRERSIPRAKVEAAIRDPDILMPGNEPDTIRAHKDFPDGDGIKVIYLDAPAYMLVITVARRD